MSRRLHADHIQAAAKDLACEPEALRAVIAVESSGRGFLADKRPSILFEGHIFYRQLLARGENANALRREYPNVIYLKWTKAYYGSGSGEWLRLDLARRIHEEAALCSASWGLFQLMGFNHALCGFASVQDFAAAMHLSEEAHLRAFLAFIQARGLNRHLREKNWAAFAKGYNGPAFAKNHYDVRLRQAYEQHKAAN